MQEIKTDQGVLTRRTLLAGAPRSALLRPAHGPGAGRSEGRAVGADLRHVCPAGRGDARGRRNGGRPYQRARGREGARWRQAQACRASIAATPPRKPRTRRSAWWRRSPTLSPRARPICRSFTLAVTEVTERAKLPVLTLSYSDLITERGFKYVFQTSATAGSQARQALPQIVAAGGKRLRQEAEDGRDHHRQYRCFRRFGQIDA